MTEVSYPIAFGAGIAAFISPCVLPLVPIYIANLGGVVSLSAEAKRRNILLHTISFIIGFSIIYTIVGAAAGLFGRFFPPNILRTMLSPPSECLPAEDPDVSRPQTEPPGSPEVPQAPRGDSRDPRALGPAHLRTESLT